MKALPTLCMTTEVPARSSCRWSEPVNSSLLDVLAAPRGFTAECYLGVSCAGIKLAKNRNFTLFWRWGFERKRLFSSLLTRSG